LEAEASAKLEATAQGGKAALVVRGNDTVIIGLECAGIRVPDHNGACVRLEGRNLLLRAVHFHDSEQGVLSAPDSGTLIIEDSLFAHLGAGGLAHAIYAGPSERLVIRRSRILAAQGEGHEVKSRAAVTEIEDSVIAGQDGRDSRLIDLPNGGALLIRHCLLQKGPRSSNGEMIGFGFEGLRHSDNRIEIERSLLIADRTPAHIVGGQIAPLLQDVVQAGGERAPGNVTWWPDRASAHLPPFPELPSQW
jgi:hypothetical protein